MKTPLSNPRAQNSKIDSVAKLPSFKLWHSKFTEANRDCDLNNLNTPKPILDLSIIFWKWIFQSWRKWGSIIFEIPGLKGYVLGMAHPGM